MPMICEVCGAADEAADSSDASTLNHLHVCSSCVQDRQHPETAGGLSDQEQ